MLIESTAAVYHICLKSKQSLISFTFLRCCDAQVGVFSVSNHVQRVLSCLVFWMFQSMANDLSRKYFAQLSQGYSSQHYISEVGDPHMHLFVGKDNVMCCSFVSSVAQYFFMFDKGSHKTDSTSTRTGFFRILGQCQCALNSTSISSLVFVFCSGSRSLCPSAHCAESFVLGRIIFYKLKQSFVWTNNLDCDCSLEVYQIILKRKDFFTGNI